MSRASSTEIPVLAFGANVTALSVLRAFGRRRTAPIYLHSAPKDLATRSRWYRPIPGSKPGEPTPETLHRFLEQSQFERAVLLPCSDTWVDAVARLPESSRKRFPVSLAPLASIRQFLDKGPLSELLDREHVPHPRTLTPSHPDDFDRLPDDAFDHAFLKPRSSQKFLDHYKVKAMHVCSRRDAKEKFAAIQKAGFEVMLQEYVPGPPTAHYFIDGFIDRDGVVRALFARQRLRMYPVDFGNSTYMQSIPLADAAPAVADLERLLRATQYRGIFSAELKLDYRDGLFKLLEVNTRPWWYLDFAEACGVPICELYYRDALDLPMDGVRMRGAGPDGYDVFRSCAYPYFDFALYNHLRGTKHAWRPTLMSCAKAWARSRQPIFAWDDPGPSITNFCFLFARTVRVHVFGMSQ